MAETFLRQSQVVGAFGPGAMVDLPERSVIIGGLNLWSSATRSEGWRLVEEPRLTAHLETVLSLTHLELRTPPEHDRRAYGVGPYVGSVIFPLWFVCNEVEDAGGGHKRRRLLRWNDLDPKSHKTFQDGPGKPRDVTPIRFVAACDRGHIQDIDWKWMIHRGDKCAGALWLEERGTSGDTRDTAVVCACGRRFTLSDVYAKHPGDAPGPLGPCDGRRPWLGEGFKQTCGKPLKLLNRTASNAYFRQSLSVISIPAQEDALGTMVSRHYDILKKAPSAQVIAIYREGNPALATDLAPFSDEEVFAGVARRAAGGVMAAGAKPREIEFETLSCGAPRIGEDRPGSLLFAETLCRQAWEGKEPKRLAGILRVVAVHRLREVVCQYGFTRFEALTSVDQAGVEERNLAVDIARIADPITWLPAIEQFGEGLFLQFEPGAVLAWLARDEVRARSDRLATGVELWAEHRFPGKPHPPFRGAAYYMAHSLSHGLMAEIALECGYPQSALKERIYADAGKLGVLIYTAAGDAEGTLGGLVALAPRVGELILRALERARLCSNDPTCSDHYPDIAEDDRRLHGAACHGCLLTSETSCEARNDFLDRALVIEDLCESGAAFFR